MTAKVTMFGEFEIPVINGLEYLVNEGKEETDFLFINEPNESFSMYFEKGFPIFTVPENTERNYGLFELKRQGRIIKFFCPEKRENINSVVWYFYLEIGDEKGDIHLLPGQVRVGFDISSMFQTSNKPKFIEVLEQIKLRAKASA